MRSIILLCMFGFVSTFVAAQNLEIVSTSPSEGATGVDTDSVVITFNSKVQFDFTDIESDTSDFFFVLVPEDSVEYLGARLSEDSLSVIIDVALGADTDFIGIVRHAEGVNGSYLEDPYLFQFTTAATAGEFVVEGTIGEEVLIKLHEEYEYEDIILILSDEPVPFGETEDDCDEEECEEDGVDIIPLYAAFVDKETGDFSISGVREGSYYPFGLEFFPEEDDFEDEEESIFDIPEIYFYDVDGDFMPDSINVNSTTAPDDTLSGIQLTTFELIPITLGEALDIAETVIDGLENDPIIAGASTFYANVIELEDEDEFGDEEELLPLSKMNYKSILTDNDEMDEYDDDYEELLAIFSSTDGTQLEWEIYGYDDVKDSVFSILVTPFGAEFYGYQSTDITDVPDTVDFDDIKELPEDFIDSDSAAYIIEMEGGADFKDDFTGEYDFWYMDLTAQHSFWEYPFDSSPDAPFTWQGVYYGLNVDELTGGLVGIGYLVVILDVETGDVLYTDSDYEEYDLEPELITLADAVSIADSVLADYPNDPQILGGQTMYGSISITLETDPDNGLNPIITSGFRPNIETTEEGPLEMMSDPDGLSYFWEVYAYDDIKDSLLVFSVTEPETHFYGYIGKEETDLPDSVEFDDLKFLPESFIDSDSAAYIVEMEGGYEFREEFSGMYDFWYMDLIASHSFWEYPFDSSVNAPVTWQGIYYGVKVDEFTGAWIAEGYLIVIIDIETGEVLFTDSAIEDYPIVTSHITFDDAVAAVDTLLDDFPNDPIVVGGTTYYNNYDIVIFKDAESKVAPNLRNKLRSMLDDSTEFMIQPDGYAFSWEIYAYDEVKDSSLVFNITEFDHEFYGYFSEDSVEGDVDFSEMSLLPEMYIDSDSAAYLIEMEAGAAFRQSLEESGSYWDWEMELQILHEYWTYPLDPTPSAPVTWKASYHAWSWASADGSTTEVLEDSMTIYLDASTGSVLFNSMAVSNEEEISAPESFQLRQNYPNPFNPSTSIPFNLTSSSRVEITVYSVLGQKVATITDQVYGAGSHTLKWDASNLSSGIYLYRMKAGDFVETKKLLLVK